MATVARSDDVRTQNRGRVLDVVRRQVVASRTDISEATGLSAATVSAITADFLEEAVLMPRQLENASAPGRGRPQIALAINPEAAMMCAVYVQLNRVSAAIVDYAGATIAEYSADVATRELSGNKFKKTLVDCIANVLQDVHGDVSRLACITVGFQGVIDARGSSVLWTPICSQRNIPVRQWLEGHFKVPTIVANDCDMITRALHWREPKKYGENFAAVLLAHGVGMGLYLRDSILNGTRSSGVEFGHMTYLPGGALCRCGSHGCIEAYAGDYAISRRALSESEHTPPLDMLESPDLESILVAAKAGDNDAIAAIESAGSAIGTGLASLFALVDRFPVVLVGRGTLFFSLMENALRERLSAAPEYNEQHPIEIECYPDENPLVQEGCAISALLAHDQEIANRRIHAEASL